MELLETPLPIFLAMVRQLTGTPTEVGVPALGDIAIPRESLTVRPAEHQPNRRLNRPLFGQPHKQSTIEEPAQ